MTYFKYLTNNRLWLYVSVMALFVLFYFAGFFFPELDMAIEGKITGVIIAVPTSVFLIGNYIKWRQLRKS